ncbi:MAG: tetraacyldisaccharide 4'-kinase [Bacteroidales bacterium]|nr:tetraacyldisaccharide 4'-kinase [Bacteroidales bacterium]MCM1148270.1 tetraacyldisaccharide 4'-kinase [Bacteroidales bacterium]MCM1206593.1 tetraacyldisaccharide 4'-kinase [Bacillota bacterium]MCM1510505.1 tetraacyldisaccharide 4'-kinase [Clostridium sp.]
MEGDFIKIYKALIPLSWLYGAGVGFRNMLFETGLLRSRSFTIPVISVGNITVGGVGKTPHVEYLVRLLRDKVRVAVLSRGYKRKTRGYILAGGDMTAADIGDEPCQMYMKYGAPSDKNRVYIAVDADRCEGIDRLRHDKETDDTDVIILDDAYQHRYVKPGVNILLVDYHRLIVYDKLLPAGRLREPKSGKERADIVIVTKCPKDLRPMDFRVIKKAMSLRPYQKLFFSTLNYGNLIPVFPEGSAMRLDELSEKHNAVVLTGIASPQQLLLDLGKYTKNLTSLAFSDHHRFSDSDIDRINNLFDTVPEPRLIITTEKDAARLRDIDGLSDAVRRSILALPIEIGFMLDGADEFNEFILSYMQKNSRNSILSRLKDSETAAERTKINFK